jgi:hypothetical protein
MDARAISAAEAIHRAVPWIEGPRHVPWVSGVATGSRGLGEPSV